MAKSNTMLEGTPDLAAMTSEDFGREYERLDGERARMHLDYDALGWKMQCADAEDRAAMSERRKEIVHRLLNDVHLEMAVAQGWRQIVQALELRKAADEQRVRAGEMEKRADDCERELHGITNVIDRDCKTALVSALRSEAARLREDARCSDMSNPLNVSADGPRGRIVDARKQIELIKQEWETVRQIVDEPSRRFASRTFGLGTEADCEAKVEQWERCIAEAERDLAAGRGEIDLLDMSTWPGRVLGDCTARARMVHAQIVERLNAVQMVS